MRASPRTFRVRGVQIPKPIPLTRISQARSIRPLPSGEVRKLRGRVAINMIEICAVIHRKSSAGTALEFARTTMPGDMIEHGIDQSGFVAVDEGVGDVHIFRNNHARRNIIAVGQLIGSGP